MTDRRHLLLTKRIHLASHPPPKTRPAISGPPPMGRLIARVGAPLRKKYGFETPHILDHWEEIVGPEFAREILPQRLSGRQGAGVLTVRAPGVLALELQHLAPQLLERINSYYGFRAIERLRFVQGPTHDRISDTTR